MIVRVFFLLQGRGPTQTINTTTNTNTTTKRKKKETFGISSALDKGLE